MALTSKSIGTWRSHVVIEGQTPQLHVHGNVPTNGQKPVFELVKSVPQGFNPFILMLDLKPADVVDPKGKSNQDIFQSFAIGAPNSYSGVLIKGIASFDVSSNLGTWKATVKTGNKTSFLVVEGDFPTNGQEPNYNLELAESQGIVHEQLLLLLRFGNLADQEGKVNQHVEFTSGMLIKEDEYTSVMVIDESGRVIAQQLIEFI